MQVECHDLASVPIIPPFPFHRHVRNLVMRIPGKGIKQYVITICNKIHNKGLSRPMCSIRSLELQKNRISYPDDFFLECASYFLMGKKAKVS